MGQLRMGVRFVASLFATLLSRLRRGPARPSWPWLFEVFVRTLQRTGVYIGGLTVTEQRVAWRAISPPNAVRREVQIEPCAHGRWVVPHGVGADAPVILYFHGGAYRYGSFESHGELVSRLAKEAGARLLFVDYRLAPEHPFPAGVEDVVKATRWVRETAPASRLVLAGDSAGGALCVATLLTLRDAGEPLPAGAVLLCPWVDLTARGGSLVENAQWDWALPEHFIDWAKTYTDEPKWKDPRVSPTFANLAGLPPLLIQVGGAEMLVDQITAFAQKAVAAGVDARLTVEPDMVHDWHMLALISPVARRSISEAAAFVRSVCA